MYAFRVILKGNDDYLPTNINRLAIIMKTKSVSCKVRTEFLIMIIMTIICIVLLLWF
jgi:hypothetical protein